MPMVAMINLLNLLLLKPPPHPRSSTLQTLLVRQGHSAPVTAGKERGLTVSGQSKAAEGPHLHPADGLGKK